MANIAETDQKQGEQRTGETPSRLPIVSSTTVASANEDAMVCYCYRRTVADLKRAHQTTGSLKGVQELTRAGTACAGCQVILQSLFGEVPTDINVTAKSSTVGTHCSKPGSRVMKGFIVANGDIESTVYSSNAVAPQFGQCDSSTAIEYALVDHRGQPVLHRQGFLKTNETFVFDTRSENVPRPFYGVFLYSISRSNFGASRFNIYWSNGKSITATHENATTGRPRVFLPLIVDQGFLRGANDIYIAAMNPHNVDIPLELTVFDVDTKEEMVWQTSLTPNASQWINANEYLFRPVLTKRPRARVTLKIETNVENSQGAQTVYFFFHNKKTNVWSANHL